MTGQFAEKDPVRCKHYAGFMADLNLEQAKSIFWILFIVVLILMCISSIQHHKSIALGENSKLIPESERNSKRHLRRVRLLRMRYCGIVALCLMLSVTCTVFEVFAALNIEYCDGEDLMQLYWGFWSVMQVGSNIAIFGVLLQLWIALGNVKNPSWAVALGTPVLVFAALGWIGREIGKMILKKVFGRESSDKSADEDSIEDEEAAVTRREPGQGNRGDVEKWLSRATTIVDGRRESMAGVLQEATPLPRRNSFAI